MSQTGTPRCGAAGGSSTGTDTLGPEDLPDTPVLCCPGLSTPDMDQSRHSRCGPSAWALLPVGRVCLATRRALHHRAPRPAESRGHGDLQKALSSHLEHRGQGSPPGVQNIPIFKSADQKPQNGSLLNKSEWRVSLHMVTLPLKQNKLRGPLKPVPVGFVSAVIRHSSSDSLT